MRGWRETETAEGLLHTRDHAPARWDVAVTRAWPAAAFSRRRYARQVRQDLWRAARNVRGFVPRVLVAADGAGVRITAGGAMATGRAAPGLADRLADILDNPNNRRRWDRYASARRGD